MSFIRSLNGIDPVFGDNCFIGPFVEIQKDVEIGNNVSIGTNATILPVKIVDNVVIGAGSVVTKDILLPGTYAGNPAKKLR